MPRYRTTSCEHCGYMQLKRDTECDQCGRMTARAKNQLTAKVVYLTMVLCAIGFGYWKLTHAIQAVAGI